MSGGSRERMDAPSLSKYLSVPAVWALSFGCIVGWGAFVMPGTTFLPMAGPVGTAVGMLVGAAAILLIGINYSYMMKLCPDAGGSFSFAKNTFGSDHGFLSAWFMMLAYVSIIWANITALALIGRNLFGDTFRFGYLYSIAGWDVYTGEVLLELAALTVFGCICAFAKRLAAHIQTVCAVLLFTGIAASFIVAITGCPAPSSAVSPAFNTDRPLLSQIFGIITFAPWAFVGFESVSNSTEEFGFPVRKTLPIMVFAIIAGALSYTMLSFTSASVLPEGCSDWTEYISDLGSHEGIEGLPAFFAILSSGGTTGMILLGTALLSAIITGLIGSSIASGRLVYSMSKDGIFPCKFGKLTKDGTPRNALLLLTIVSAVIPFLGRTAIGWVVDVITVGSTVAYAYTSAAAFRNAKNEGNRKIMITGAAGTVISALIALLLLVPDLLSMNTLSSESYLLLAFWAILGIIYFRIVFSREKHSRYGKSTVVWIALLFLIFFTSMMWIRQDTDTKVDSVIDNISTYYSEKMEEDGLSLTGDEKEHENIYLHEQMDDVHHSLMNHSIIQIALIMLSLIIVFNIYATLRKREKELELQKAKAEANSKAKTVFLSNMSHDIRTPMNAITGYLALAKRENTTFDEMKEYIRKIDGSSRHLLALINNVLEMSRVESGKAELEEEPCDLRSIMNDVYDMFSTQMKEKSIDFSLICDNIGDRAAICDRTRLNRVLLNLVSNAYKFTPEGGSISLKLERISVSEDGESAEFELRVKDSGIGMTEEFAAKVFKAFERERTSTVSGIQGTGLGMAITKSLVELMHGTIEVVTAPGKGTEFITRLPMKLGNSLKAPDAPAKEKPEIVKADFAGKRLLLVDDVEINRELAAKILRHLGFTVEIAVNGKDALDRITASSPGEFDAVLMDIQMPVMDGYDASRSIRALPDERTAAIPIIAMTANAFSEDVQRAREAGMNAHVAKPIDINVLKQTLYDILKTQTEQ